MAERNGFGVFVELCHSVTNFERSSDLWQCHQNVKPRLAVEERARMELRTSLTRVESV